MITINISGQYPNPLTAFRYAIFQIASIITTTGYATADYNVWPMFSQCILVLLMVIGACASSTGGGMKVSRVLIVFKSIKQEIKRLVHPQSVNIIRINGKKMGNDILKSVYMYLMAYAGITVLSILLVSLDNKDFATTFSSVMATLNNIGPGLSKVGPNGNFADFSILSKLVFCFDMLAGRLEIFPFLMLLTAFSWRKRF